ncbi:MAG: 50S ribosomal protein L24 [Deltaproteobacteria bacterium]|jgi:large subunit ribosomal protein L24|nr:50S ribosomal protein L24 [Deltaproteobacteria bacterium]
MTTPLNKRGKKGLNTDLKKICPFRKGDRLVVIAGKHKKSMGTVRSIDLKKSSVIIEGVNLVVRHTKADVNRQQAGGKVEKEAPLHVSNAMLVCPKCMKPTRVSRGFVESEETGGKKKVRVCKRCKGLIDDK